MKANLIFLCLTIICMASCSSPKTDGVKLAQESCDNTESYIAKTIQAYNNFVKDFSDKGYKSRVEARTDLEKRLAEVQFSFKAKNDEIDDEYSQLLAKYEDDYRKVTEMVNAHKMIIDSYATDSTMFNTLREQANSKILSIIPNEPDKSKLLSDLVGRQIHALPGGYFDNTWVWKIGKGDITDLQIQNAKSIDVHNKEYLVSITLKCQGAAYKICGKLFYKLEDGDDWEIDVLEPSEIEIVKTDRYNGSISSEVSTYIMGKYLNIRNNSDAALLVGYQILDSHGVWKKYSKIISGGNSSSQLILGLEDYKIDFVERP